MKKSFIKIIVFIVFIFGIFILFSPQLKASDLDYIHNYEIKVDVRKDGTLDMTYHITWEVLDSKSEGPLEWVKIGIVNCFVDEIVPLTDNIKQIDYLNDSGSFIRIDFKNKYYQGQICEFAFKIHQKRMYFLDNNDVIYDFANGYFSSIKVKNATIYWNSDGVLSTNDLTLVGNYYQISSSLDYGERLVVHLKYDKSYFDPLDPKLGYSDESTPLYEKIIIISLFTVLLIALIVSITIAIKKQDPYYQHRGFVGHNYWRHYYFYHRFYGNGVNGKGDKLVLPSNVNSRGGHAGSACACACACAGGGRAGCSRKDFYKKEEHLE